MIAEPFLSTEKIHIVGIGDDGLEGLTSRARELLAQAEVIIGDARALAAVHELPAEKVAFDAGLDGVVRQVAAHRDRRAVVLTTGDPLFYGTARFLCERLGKDHFDVLPHVSSMQLAFARIKESWDDAYLASLATQPLERVVEKARVAEKVGLFTTDAVTPADVARALLDSHIDYFLAYVCENLGSPDERVTRSELADLIELEFSPLNVMVLVRKPHRPDRATGVGRLKLFGNPDEQFLQSRPKRGLLTPAEVRCIALAALDLSSSDVVWDVGAGSGSVAIEAARLAPHSRVFAIEMDAEDHQLIVANAERFGVRNLTAILGQAPDAWQDLPAPDAVFVGGSGRQVRHIVELAYGRLKPGGRVVATVSTIDNLAAVREALEQQAGEAQVWMINVARGNYQMERMVFESLNPIFLLGATKPE